MTELVRLQKFLSQQGICSRRQAESYIEEGRVTINGEGATIGDKVKAGDIVTLDGSVIENQSLGQIVVLFFKPKGVETTMKSLPETKTIVDYDFGVGRVFPIGRLDKDSQGLLLLTNDGDLANHLAHPRYQKEKEYLVHVEGNITSQALGRLRDGVVIEDRKTEPCRVEVVEPTVLRFILKEGRNRQIRKMCEAVGLTVVELLRIRIGKIKLGEMKPGKFRILSDVEIKSLSV